MEVNLKVAQLKAVKDEILAVGVLKDEELPFKELTRFLRADEFNGKDDQTAIISSLGRFDFKKLFLYGLGEQKEFDLDKLRRFSGSVVRYARSIRSTSLSIALPQINSINKEHAAQALTEGALLASYKFTKFKTKKDDLFEIKKATIVTEEKGLENAILYASTIASAQNWTREIDEHPANFITPKELAKVAMNLAKERKLKIKVFEKKDIEKLGMGGLLAVAQGSVNPPVFIVLEYNAHKKDLPLYCIVGKGVTFDSGGISLKPSKGLQEMKYDKSGATITLGIIKAVSELKLPIRLMAVIPATENLPSGSAQKPGDIITSYNGKTIEIINTDAEGRLILADALSYATKAKPEAIIDIATLTGLMKLTLGRHGIGLFSNDEELISVFKAAGGRTYERVWQFPLWKEYAEMNKSDIADIKNIGSEVGEAGSITAAFFLKEFIGDARWVHLDIAGTSMFAEPHHYLENGATGIGVRLVTEVLAELSSYGKGRDKK